MSSGFTKVAAGQDYSLGLKVGGSVVAWGLNAHGQCNVPSPNTGFIAVAAGGSSSLALQVNIPPIANAGPDQAVIEQRATVQLDGSDSYDLDGDDITYFWTITQVPEGSLAVLSDPASPVPAFVADVYGEYVITLVVTDSLGSSSDGDSVTVSFTNIKPVAEAGGNQSIYQGDLVSLNGSGSSDINGDTLTYSWSIVSVPEGSLAQLTDPASVSCSFTADLPGAYVVSLVVSDGLVDSDADSVTIMAISSETAAAQMLLEAVPAVNGLDPNSLVNRVALPIHSLTR